MKTSFVAVLAAAAGVAHAWHLDFYGTGKQYIKTHGTRDVGCNNLASDFTEPVSFIEFKPATDWYKDPTVFTAYNGPDCEGRSYTGRGGYNTLDKPMRIRSYSLH